MNKSTFKTLVPALLTAGLWFSVTGCANLNISWPQIIFEPAADETSENLQAYTDATHALASDHTQEAWLQLYMNAGKLSQEERQARLLAIGSLLGQPEQNQVTLALEQASLLAVHAASRKQWSQANQTLSEMPVPEKGSNAALYRDWLKAELAWRFRNVKKHQILSRDKRKQKQQIELLNNEIQTLQEKVDSLEGQIEALTNIEQSLTEKKVGQ